MKVTGDSNGQDLTDILELVEPVLKVTGNSNGQDLAADILELVEPHRHLDRLAAAGAP